MSAGARLLRKSGTAIPRKAAGMSQLAHGAIAVGFAALARSKTDLFTRSRASASGRGEGRPQTTRSPYPQRSIVPYCQLGKLKDTRDLTQPSIICFRSNFD